MKIRSITYFTHLGYPLDDNRLRSSGRFLTEAKKEFEQAGYEVQTTRLATTSFAQFMGDNIDETPTYAAELENLLSQIDVAYASLGPAYPHIPASYAVIPGAIARTKNIFFSGTMADIRNGISLEAVQACAQTIVECAKITSDGFSNLRFAALANVPPGSPFFPAAYHQDNKPAFSLATEAADLAVEAFRQEDSINKAIVVLVNLIEENAQKLVAVARRLSFRFGPVFGGIDFSLAPFPRVDQSLGEAVEAMGVPEVGLHGSLAAAALLTDAIETAKFPHSGFCGFMQPVLEDSVFAKRAAEGTLTIKDLLLYSSVCGTGLDTVPLPGDTSAEQMTALLLDLSALALRLNKPLTARLMPIPGKIAGDPTDFDFSFFANSRVMRLDAQPLGRLFQGKENIFLKGREEST